MASEEDRLRHSTRRRKKYLEKKNEVGERKGAFSIKIKDNRVPEYKREKIDLKHIEDYIDE